MENQALGGSGNPSGASLAELEVKANPVIDNESADIEVDGSVIGTQSPQQPPALAAPAIAAHPAPPPLPTRGGGPTVQPSSNHPPLLDSLSH